MKVDKIMSADEAIRLIKDGDTVGLIGGGGGLCEATVLHQAVERRFLQSGAPRNLTCVHALGIGDRDRRGMNCFAYKGLVKRVVGGHWAWSPRMQEMARNPSAMIDAPSQFDFYSGGGLDIAFLGFDEVDHTGNVNASKLGDLTVGPGGFVNIAQNARKVVFCGGFDAKGATCHVEGGRLNVEKPGKLRKFIDRVEQITFSGRQAMIQAQEVLYVTEHAVFRLVSGVLRLEEVAPGIDLEADMLGRMTFQPVIADALEPMPQACFEP